MQIFGAPALAGRRPQYLSCGAHTCATRDATPTAEMRCGCVQTMLHSAPRPARMAASRRNCGTYAPAHSGRPGCAVPEPPCTHPPQAVRVGRVRRPFNQLLLLPRVAGAACKVGVCSSGTRPARGARLRALAAARRAAEHKDAILRNSVLHGRRMRGGRQLAARRAHRRGAPVLLPVALPRLRARAAASCVSLPAARPRASMRIWRAPPRPCWTSHAISREAGRAGLGRVVGPRQQAPALRSGLLGRWPMLPPTPAAVAAAVPTPWPRVGGSRRSRCAGRCATACLERRPGRGLRRGRAGRGRRLRRSRGAAHGGGQQRGRGGGQVVHERRARQPARLRGQRARGREQRCRRHALVPGRTGIFKHCPQVTESHRRSIHGLFAQGDQAARPRRAAAAQQAGRVPAAAGPGRAGLGRPAECGHIAPAGTGDPAAPAASQPPAEGRRASGPARAAAQGRRSRAAAARPASGRPPAAARCGAPTETPRRRRRSRRALGAPPPTRPQPAGAPRHQARPRLRRARRVCASRAPPLLAQEERGALTRVTSRMARRCTAQCAHASRPRFSLRHAPAAAAPPSRPQNRRASAASTSEPQAASALAAASGGYPNAASSATSLGLAAPGAAGRARRLLCSTPTGLPAAPAHDQAPRA